MRSNYVDENSSEETLISYCKDPPPGSIVDDVLGGVRVVKLDSDAVIKTHLWLSQTEADNQRYARKLLDPSIIRVPEVYRYFTDAEKRQGYLVMEYVDGHSKDSLNTDETAQMARILNYLTTFCRDFPGPISGGFPEGLLFPDIKRGVRFDSTVDLERWMNGRLRESEGRIALRKFDLVLCHLDLAPSNWLWKDDGTVYLIDWASAGFYPRFFEVVAQRIRSSFCQSILDGITKLSVEEEAQAFLLQISFGNGVRYYFRHEKELDNDEFPADGQDPLSSVVSRSPNTQTSTAKLEQNGSQRESDLKQRTIRKSMRIASRCLKHQQNKSIENRFAQKKRRIRSRAKGGATLTSGKD